MANRPEITVTKDGPYKVSGDLALRPKRVVVSADGEPLTWLTGSEVPHDSPTWLCRCGQSKNKPFCDGSHRTVGFDGTETASNAPFTERAKSYEGPGLTVRRVGSLCAHASFCANRITDWHQLLPDTGDTNVQAEVIAMIEHCPSGALVAEIEGRVVEPDLPPCVSPVEDGPLWVTGKVSIVGSDGVELEARNRVTLCRCGQSKNKPFCDGTHSEIEFEAKDPAHFVAADAPPKAPAEATPSVYGRIVLGVHEATSDETYRVAAMIARPAESDVSLVHAGTQSEPNVLSDALERAHEAGIPPERLRATLRTDDPGTALDLAAVEADAGLMIVGRGGDRLARLPRRVSHRSPCDVLVVARLGLGRPDRYRRILIATDGSKTADRAARRGYDLARALDAAVDLVFVGHPATGELIISDTLAVYGRDVRTETWIPQGNPAQRILETAAAIPADLIVVGNKGMTGARMLSGTSVPGAVLKGAHCDVLLCRTVHQRESELEPGDGGIIERHGEPVAAYVDEHGVVHLASARCPHLGCLVAWNPLDKTFDCTCHSSRFGPLGELLQGPATKPLRPL